MRIKHIPSNKVFNNRKEAKKSLGHANYNRAVTNKEIEYLPPLDEEEN